MSLQLPDPDSEFGVRVARRLRDEPIAWLTHVDGAGTPQPAPDEPPVHENPPYLAKYGERITEGWGTAEKFASIYSVPLRVRLRRVRGH